MVSTKPVDFRKGAEGLAALVRETMGADPFSGARLTFSGWGGPTGFGDRRVFARQQNLPCDVSDQKAVNRYVRRLTAQHAEIVTAQPAG